jgi:hypothetical protein
MHGKFKDIEQQILTYHADCKKLARGRQGLSFSDQVQRQRNHIESLISGLNEPTSQKLLTNALNKGLQLWTR